MSRILLAFVTMNSLVSLVQAQHAAGDEAGVRHVLWVAPQKRDPAEPVDPEAIARLAKVFRAKGYPSAPLQVERAFAEAMSASPDLPPELGDDLLAQIRFLVLGVSDTAQDAIVGNRFLYRTRLSIRVYDTVARTTVFEETVEGVGAETDRRGASVQAQLSAAESMVEKLEEFLVDSAKGR